MRRPVIVTIDELRLYGFDVRRRYAVGDALSCELERLFAQEGAPDRGRNVARAEGGSIPIARGSSPAVIGTSVAANVYGAVKKPC